jgi:phosphoadenosine phosphosulfate reductase
MALYERAIDVQPVPAEDGHAENGPFPPPQNGENETVSALNALLSNAGPEEIIAAALRSAPPGRFGIVSSFGTESAVMLAAAAQVDPAIPVLFVDTGYHFPETLGYRDQLQERLRLSNTRSLTPDETETAAEDVEGDLFQRDPDACCALRKVRPLGRALDGFDAWANGRKRYQSAGRNAIPIVEADGARLKFNPLVNLSRAEIVGRFRALGLPLHPLEKFGFASIGCMPCTSRVLPGEDPRAGRWRGRGKVECGIHTGPVGVSTAR